MLIGMVMKKMLLTLMAALLLLLPVSARSMTFEDERKLSREVVTYLDAQGLIMYDQEITWPVKMIAEKLADHVKNPIYTFNVSVINDRSVNAFTIPDGHIFMNLGTLLFARDMEEIAAVIGHEMGHAQLRHIPQGYEQQKDISAVSLLGVVLGALVSAKSPQAGSALIFSSIGGGENVKLAYSRRHEHDADDFGRQLLSSSGYDPSAMNSFLSRLGGLTSSKKIPEYLLTHPMSSTRISGDSPDSHEPRPDAYYWSLMSSIAGLVLSQEEGAQRAQTFPEPYRKLALAMIDTNKGEHAKALEGLKGVNLPLANTYRALNLALMGRKEEAYPLLKQFGSGSARAQMALADIMEERGEYEQAIAVLSPYQKGNIKIEYRLGLLHQKSNHEALSHVSFARYFFKTGKGQAATFHIGKALEKKNDLAAEVQDELKEMKDFIKKQEAR
jgi:Zn-dependent protease with chaperone function